MTALKISLQVLGIIGTVISVLTAYKYIFWVVGVFRKRKFPPAKKQHQYGICVAARNEAKVITNLLDSIANQDYPLSKVRVFVCAHNCTDETAALARAYPKDKLDVVVFEYNNPDERTKGFALQHLFAQIDKKYGLTACDGYFIFDADNLLHQDYLTRMNEAFDAGNKIVTSFRNSKNMHQNWIAYGYAMHWLRTCLYENRGKSLLNQACRIQGTGYLFANELVQNGWLYTSLTEDRAFQAGAVIQNYRVSYCDDAIFYDEQPYKIKIAWRQRVRWAKGNQQVFGRCGGKLIKNMFQPKKYFPTAYDCFWLNFPRALVSSMLRLLSRSLSLVLAIWVGTTFGSLWWGFFTFWGHRTLVQIRNGLITQIFIFLIYRQRLSDAPYAATLLHALLFPLFDIIGTLANWVALFTKVEWKPIPHDQVLDLEQISVKK